MGGGAGGGRGTGGRREKGGKKAGNGSSKMAGCGSEMQNATRCQVTHHQLSAPASKSNTVTLRPHLNSNMEMGAIVTSVNHTLEYMP